MAFPVPGADEVNLVAKVGTSVVRGLSQPSQPPPWPNTRDALLELLAILDEWSRRAAETTNYATFLYVTQIRDPSTARLRFKEAQRYTNVASGFASIAQADIRHSLMGQVPPLAKLRRSKKRRAARRGLRTILLAYCPDLLKQFDEATAARFDWVAKHSEGFERWFDGSHTKEEVTQLLAEMNDTQTRLLEVVASLRSFITLNFPLTDNARGS
jgi:hypothetical protein